MGSCKRDFHCSGETAVSDRELVICLFLLVLQLVLAVFHAGSRE